MLNGDKIRDGSDGGGGRIRTFEVDDGRFTVCSLWPLGMVVGEGFEPSKSMTADLQSAPFGRSGTPPGVIQIVGKA